MGHITLLLLLVCVLYLPLADVFASLQKCSSGEFSCNNGRCVPLILRCDGVDHCEDRSDESSCFDCNTASVHCTAAAPCIHSRSICDGKPDCPDGEDENACTDLKSRVCTRSEFTCANGQCVPSSWRCDHSNDCQDGSDELDCDVNECEYENGGCSHLCVDMPLGFICDCPSGMQLIQDTHCEDVDQCLVSDVCDQICIHSNDSLACECQHGYDLTPGTGQCKATGGVAHMAVCTREGVMWMDLYGSEEQNITSWVTVGSPGPIAAHNTKNTLFWASPDEDSIYRIAVDSSHHSPSELIKASTGILGLAVDELHEHLYWVSTSTHGLHMASLNGSDQRQLISGLSRPTAVAVQPKLGHLFWADSGASPRIERARLDGHRRIALITFSIRYPVAISLDIPRGLLYWADSGLHTISRVAFDGKHRKTVVESNGYLDRPFGLAVFESRVYWSDQLTNSTCSANKHNGKELQVSQKLSSVLPAGLAIFQPPLRPADKDLPLLETIYPLTDSPYAWILFLTGFLSLLLVGGVLCWQRSKLSAPRSLIRQMSFKESQDPLLLTGPPVVHEHKGDKQAAPELKKNVFL